MLEKGQGMAKEGKAKAAVVDFTNVKEGGNFNKKHYPGGDYKGKVLKVVDAVKKDDKKVKMWLFTIEVKSGKYPYYITPGAENQAWKVRNLFVAAGIAVPKKRVQVDPNKVVGKFIGVTLEDEEYEGKMQSVVASVFPTSELDGDTPDDDEDEPDEDTPKKKKGKKAKQADPVEAPQGSGKKGKHGKKGKDKVKKSELDALDIEDV